MDYQEITLLGGAKVHVDFDSRMVECKKCGKKFRFGLTRNNKLMPIVKVGEEWQSHFADCPAAAKFRKGPAEQRVEDIENNQKELNKL